MTVKLTPTQRRIASYVAELWSSREIAVKMGVKPRTIEKHIENIACAIPGDRPPMRRIAQWWKGHNST